MNTDKDKKISIEQSGMVQSSISLAYHDQIDFVPKCKLQIQFKNVVYQTRSKFQEITVLDSALDDPRVKMYFEDGAKFVADRSNAYEVILVDSTDPIGPGQILFQRHS